MRTRVAALVALLSCTALAAGCATRRVVPVPSDITLEEALVSVARGLAQMKAEAVDVKTGLLPAEAEVVFNVTTSATDSRRLVLDLEPAAGTPVSGDLRGEAGTQVAASRGNQIRIRFENLLYASDRRLVTQKTPAEIAALLRALEGAGLTVYSVPVQAP
jgi:hypothetical protein